MKKRLMIELASVVSAIITALIIIYVAGFVVLCISWYADSYAAFKGAIG